ncbi:MAG: hypothetical protein ACFFD2_14165 [Promethearchaeota archaeon]
MELFKISLREDLKKARIPENEIEKILNNLKILEKMGLSKEDIKIVMKNIISNPSFKDDFMKDPKSALRKIRSEIGFGL